MKLSEIRKTVITVLGLVVSVGAPILHIAGGFLPAPAVLLISSVVGVATMVLNYLVPNTTTDPQVAATQSVRLKTGV